MGHSTDVVTGGPACHVPSVIIYKMMLDGAYQDITRCQFIRIVSICIFHLVAFQHHFQHQYLISDCPYHIILQLLRKLRVYC